MKVLVSDSLSEEGLKLLKKEKNITFDVKTKLSEKELVGIIGDYDALIIRSSTKVTKNVINAATKLKVVGRAGVGVDNIDVNAASKKGVIVMNTPGGNTISTAEHTMSMILALSRNIPQSFASLKNAKWERNKFLGVELLGKTLGIIGLGRIGAEVAKRSASFGMKIVANDPFLAIDKVKSFEVELVDFDTLLAKSDYITVHVPLTDKTKHLISKKEFGMMKKGVRILNCARGGIIDEKALYNAIVDGKVAGAALDVFEEEPPVNNPLLELDNVIATPHLGAATEEAQVNVAVDIVQQVIDTLNGKAVKNAINIPSTDPELLKALKPYIALAEKVGALQAQLIQGHISKVNITYSGDIASHNLESVTLAVIKGMLEPTVGKEKVNYVNASFIAKERGINVVESKSSYVEDYANLISVKVEGGKQSMEISATLFTQTDPRIVKIDGFHVDAIPQGYMLVIWNKDAPGIVGQIGTILGAKKINIAGMTFGRESARGKAITVLNVDSAISPAVLKSIKSAKNIWDAKLIKL